MDRHKWSYEEVQYCIERIFENFVLNEEYEYEKLLNELYIHFDTKIKKSSLKMFFSNIKHLFNQNKVPNTLMICELKNVSLDARTAFNIAMKKYNQIFRENKNIKTIEKETQLKKENQKLTLNECSVNRYAGVGSTVTYRILEDDDVNQVTIVEPANKKSDNEVSKTSELGETLLYRKEGEVVKVNSVEPYTISILHIANPLNNVRYGIEQKGKSDFLVFAKQNNNYNMQANSKSNKYGEYNMTNAEEQRKIFWETFEDVLMENGEPFSICYTQGDKPQSWANVNRKHAWNANAIDLSFLNQQGLFRVDLYMENGEQDQIGRKIKANKEDINSMISFPVKWENGKKNPNTLRPSVYFPFIKNNKDDYRRVIEESLPTILKFIEVANKYGKNMFFDF